MISKTGNKLGFTLIEVMAASCVLALGITLVYQAFFVSMDLFDYRLTYFEQAPFLDEKVWQIKEALESHSASGAPETRGEFVKGQRAFSWGASQTLIDEAKGVSKLFKIEALLFWHQGARQRSIARSAYALVYEE